MAKEAAAAAPPPTTDLALPLERWTREHALAVAKESPEAMADTVMALIAHDTNALPGTTFVRRKDDVFLRKHIVGVKLTEREGHLISMGKHKMDYALAGLRRLNEVASLQIMRPDQVMVGGEAQMNPYIQVNDKTRMPEVVYARTFAVGYSPFGSLVATDVMVRLDIAIYLLENILSKMKQLGDHARRLAEYGTADEPPVYGPEDGEDNGKPRVGKWRFMPVHSVGDIGLWVNMRAPEFAEVMKDHVTRLKFIERLAQSFAERNALKAHPAMPKTVSAERGVALVRVGGWTTDFDRTEIERLRLLAQDDRLHEFDESIEVEAVEVRDLTPADMASMEEAAQSEQRFEKKEEGPDEDEAADAPADDPLPRASELFTALVEMKGKAGARKDLAAHGIEHLEEAAPENLLAFIAAAEKEVAG